MALEAPKDTPFDVNIKLNGSIPVNADHVVTLFYPTGSSPGQLVTFNGATEYTFNSASWDTNQQVNITLHGPIESIVRVPYEISSAYTQRKITGTIELEVIEDVPGGCICVETAPISPADLHFINLPYGLSSVYVPFIAYTKNESMCSLTWEYTDIDGVLYEGFFQRSVDSPEAYSLFVQITSGFDVCNMSLSYDYCYVPGEGWTGNSEIDFSEAIGCGGDPGSLCLDCEGVGSVTTNATIIGDGSLCSPVSLFAVPTAQAMNGWYCFDPETNCQWIFSKDYDEGFTGYQVVLQVNYCYGTDTWAVQLTIGYNGNTGQAIYQATDIPGSDIEASGCNLVTLSYLALSLITPTGDCEFVSAATVYVSLS